LYGGWYYDTVWLSFFLLPHSNQVTHYWLNFRGEEEEGGQWGKDLIEIPVEVGPRGLARFGEKERMGRSDIHVMRNIARPSELPPPSVENVNWDFQISTFYSTFQKIHFPAQRAIACPN